MIPSGDQDHLSADESDISLRIPDTFSTLKSQTLCTSSSATPLATVEISKHQSQASKTDIAPENNPLGDCPSDDNSVPVTRSRSRSSKKATSTIVLTQKQPRGKSVSKHDAVDHSARSLRPVIYAVPQVPSRMNRTSASSVVNYTINDLMKGCEMDPTEIPPSVRTSYLHMDPNIMSPYRYSAFSSIL